MYAIYGFNYSSGKAHFIKAVAVTAIRNSKAHKTAVHRLFAKADYRIESPRRTVAVNMAIKPFFIIHTPCPFRYIIFYHIIKHDF